MQNNMEIHLRYTAMVRQEKMQLKNAGKELQNVLERLKRRYISHPAGQKVITGRSEVPVGYGKIRENILFQQK